MTEEGRKGLVAECPKCGIEEIDRAGDGFLKCNNESCGYCAHARIRRDTLGANIFSCPDCGLRWELVGKLWHPVGQAVKVAKTRKKK